MIFKVKRLLFTTVLAAVMAFNATAQEHDMNYYLARAPFKMPAIAEPAFKDQTFNITDYGAVSNGQTLNTQAINNAIDACSKAGGGKVIIPPGLWLTGPIVLKSNVNLHADRGALVIFSPDHSLYAMLPGGKVQTLISGTKLENVALTGEGIYDGAGDTWRPLKKSKAAPALWNNLIKSGGVVDAKASMWWPTQQGMEGEAYLKQLKDKASPGPEDYLPARDFLRPNLAVISNSTNVLIDGPTFKNSPKFALNPSNCTNLIIRNVHINNEYYAQNGDGIDLSACKNAVIYHCTVSTGDDGICMKSSAGKNSSDEAPALENIVIADCIVYHAHGGFVIGSNTDGGMRNIYVTNCNFVNTDIGIRVKSNRGRGGLVQNVYIDNIFMRDILDEVILFSTYYEDNEKDSAKVVAVTPLTPRFQNFYMSRIYCNNAQTAISVTGLPEMPVNHIYLTDAVISAHRGVVATEMADISLKNVQLLTPGPTLMQLDNSRNILLDNIGFAKSTTTFIAATGAKTTGIRVINTKGINGALQVGKEVKKKAISIK